MISFFIIKKSKFLIVKALLYWYTIIGEEDEENI